MEQTWASLNKIGTKLNFVITNGTNLNFFEKKIGTNCNFVAKNGTNLGFFEKKLEQTPNLS